MIIYIIFRKIIDPNIIRLLQTSALRWFLLSQLLGFSASPQAIELDSMSNSDLVFAKVVVEGLGNPATASYTSLLRGLAAFDANKQLAPNARLTFNVIELKKAETPLALRLEMQDRVVGIPLDSAGDFVLPKDLTVSAGDGELVANRREGEVVIGPRIHSPGFSQTSQRLGDIRLWCEVAWAIEQDPASIKVRAFSLFIGGVCKSPRVKIFQKYYGGILDRVELSQNEKIVKIPVSQERNAFSLPLHDRRWSDDATVTLIYKDNSESLSRPVDLIEK